MTSAKTINTEPGAGDLLWEFEPIDLIAYVAANPRTPPAMLYLLAHAPDLTIRRIALKTMELLTAEATNQTPQRN